MCHAPRRLLSVSFYEPVEEKARGRGRQPAKWTVSGTNCNAYASLLFVDGSAYCVVMQLKAEPHLSERFSITGVDCCSLKVRPIAL